MGDQTEQKPPEAQPPTGPKKSESEPAKSFWTTLPGILAQSAVVIGALTALIVALNNAGIIGSRASDTPPPTLSAMSMQTSTHTPTPPDTLAPTPTLTPILTPAPILMSTPMQTSTHTPTPTDTLAPTPTLAPISAAKLELCARPMEDRAVVREGPDTTTFVLVPGERVPAEACMIFDQRLPDNTWVHVAEEQRDPAMAKFALGWVKSELLSESDEIVRLNPYIPEDAKTGYYCIKIGSGMNVRDCADTACRQNDIIPILKYYECLYFDARLENSSWLRIAAHQDDATYTPLAGNWVSTENFSLTVREFQDFDRHDMRPYFELLPVVTPPPTPQG